MIVRKYFVGDSEGQTQQLQASVCSDALRIIGDCAGREKLAHMGLSDDWSETLNPSDGFDHPLQAAHDILAAAWRFRHAYWYWERWHPPDVPLDVPLWDTRQPRRAAHWLKGLENETKSWRQVGEGFSYSYESNPHNPHLADLVVRILENQNNSVGCRAKKQLAWELVNRFKDVPWDQSWLSSVKSDYEALL